jgi:hypothetical protein
MSQQSVASPPLPHRLTPGYVAMMLFLIIALLTVLSVAEQAVIHLLGRADLEEYLIALDLDAEGNFPTWYASFQLLAAALLLFVIGMITRQRGERYAGHWKALGMILVALSIDEIAQLHEHLGHLHETWQTHGILYFAWVVPGLIAVAVVAVLFLRFALHLPSATRNRLLAAAVVYFVGALGVEALSGWRAETMGYNNMSHSLIATVEEVMELTGVAMVIVALLRHMQAHGMALTLSADEPGAK